MTEPPAILLIDDDPDYLASTRALLENEGFAVTEARSADEGLDLLLSRRFDLIVVDLIMENLTSGYSFVQAIRSLPDYGDHHTVPIIMVSSVEKDPGSMYGWIGDPAPITPDAYFSKPLDISRFVERVRSLVHSRP